METCGQRLEAPHSTDDLLPEAASDLVSQQTIFSPPKAELVHSIQLDSYYAIWASERRNYPESQLTFLKRGESYSFIEEIFQYKMGNNIEGDPFLLSKIQQAEGKLANTTFEHFGDLEKLRSKFADFKEYPNINESHDRVSFPFSL